MKRAYQAKLLEKELPGPKYDHDEKEEIRRLQQSSQNNPWDFMGRRQMDKSIERNSVIQEGTNNDYGSENQSHQDSAFKVDPNNPMVRNSLIKSDNIIKNRQEINFDLHDDEQEQQRSEGI
jgi:hypothetical protein